MYRILLAASLSAAALVAADPALLKLLPADSSMVAGANVDRIRKTSFGQYVFSKLPAEEASFEAFKQATGFDPQRDLEGIIAGSTGESQNGLLVIRGRFELERIRPFLSAMASVKRESVSGVEMFLASGDGPKAFAFLSPSVVVAGEEALVRAALDATKQTGPDAAMSAKALELSASQDAWVVTRNAASLARGFSDRNLEGAMKGDLFKSIEQSSAGVVFGDVARFTAQATLKTEQDASAMADVARFLFNLMQAQGPKGTLGSFVGAVQGFDTSAQGRQVNVGFQVPEAKILELLEGRARSARR